VICRPVASCSSRHRFKRYRVPGLGVKAGSIFRASRRMKSFVSFARVVAHGEVRREPDVDVPGPRLSDRAFHQVGGLSGAQKVAHGALELVLSQLCGRRDPSTRAKPRSSPAYQYPFSNCASVIASDSTGRRVCAPGAPP
jgi:hypothetical protein